MFVSVIVIVIWFGLLSISVFIDETVTIAVGGIRFRRLSLWHGTRIVSFGFE